MNNYDDIKSNIVAEFPSLSKLDSGVMEVVLSEILRGNSIYYVEKSPWVIVIFDHPINKKEIEKLIKKENINNLEYYEDASNRFTGRVNGFSNHMKKQSICAPFPQKKRYGSYVN